MSKIIRVPILIAWLAISPTLLRSANAAHGRNTPSAKVDKFKDVRQVTPAGECKDTTSYDELRCPEADDALQSSATTDIYSMSPFELSAEKLPSDYHGHDSEAVYERLSQGRMKSEFETTAEYNYRLAQMATKPIFGFLTLSSVFAFSVQDDEIKSHYDADSKNLSVSIRLWSVSKEREVPQQCSERITSMGLCRNITEHYVGAHAIWLKTKMLNRGDYLGTNAYGATTRVESRLRIEYKLEFTNLDEFPTRK